MSQTSISHDFGSGTLTRAAAFVYWHLIVGILLCAGSLPTVVLLFFLDRSPGNVALVPLAGLLMAPTLSAGLYAMRDRPRAPSLAPAASFWRGLRSGWADALRAWTAPMAALSVIAFAIVSLDAAGIPAAYAGVLLTIGLIVVLWAINALVIATVFSFRTGDTLRLAVHYIGRRLVVTVGAIALIVVAVALVAMATEAVLWLAQVIWISYLAFVTRPLVADVTARFTVEGSRG